MERSDLKLDQYYQAKVIGITGVRKVKINTILTNVVTCRDSETKQMVVARIRDVKEL